MSARCYFVCNAPKRPWLKYGTGTPVVRGTAWRSVAHSAGVITRHRGEVATAAFATAAIATGVPEPYLSQGRLGALHTK